MKNFYKLILMAALSLGAAPCSSLFSVVMMKKLMSGMLPMYIYKERTT